MNFQDVLKNIVIEWKLSYLRPFSQSHQTQNYVAVVYSAVYKKDVVLKICQSDFIERKVLSYFDGMGCVKLLNYNEQYKALLIEYVQPGVSLKSFFPKEDDAAIKITATLIKKLHEGKELSDQLSGYATVEKQLHLLSTFSSRKISAEILQKAQKTAARLVATQGQLYLLHGDVHHENILQSGDDWVVIDPQGVIGELAYEVCAFIRNPIPELLEQQNPEKIIQRRIDLFADFLPIDRQRIIDWSFVQAILCACWAEQDTSNSVNYFIAFAKIIFKFGQR